MCNKEQLLKIIKDFKPNTQDLQTEITTEQKQLERVLKAAENTSTSSSTGFFSSQNSNNNKEDLENNDDRKLDEWCLLQYSRSDTYSSC